MIRTVFVIIMTLWGCVCQMRSQDMLAQKAPVDTKLKTTNPVQSETDTVSTIKARPTNKKGGHMLFMGIPIDGSLEEFAPLLVDRNFRQDRSMPWNFTGRFYETLSSVNVATDKNSNNVSSVEVTFYTGVNGLSDEQMGILYKRITRGLKQKYTSAKYSQAFGETLLSTTAGYISCRIFRLNFSKSIGGGTYIKLKYVDKMNTSNYSLPRLNKADEDL